MNVHIAGFGIGLPAHRMTNEELSRKVDTTDEWIVSHTGIRARHVVGPHESTATLATDAARKALEHAGVKPEDVGLVIVATSTPDYHVFPSCACLVQSAIGAVNAAAFDVLAACTGFVYAMDVARSMMARDGRPAVVIGADVMTRTVDWSDRNTCVLFGDGAGAVVLKVEDRAGGLGESILRADGSGANMLFADGGYRLPREKGYTNTFLQMNGRKVFAFATTTIEEVIRQLVEKQGISLHDIRWVVPHQANIRILESAAKRLDIPMDRFYINIAEVANTSAATIPLALGQMANEKRFVPGDYIVLVGFGAGLTWGAMLIQWQP